MNKKAIILDLDNTIYPVSSIGQELLEPLFKRIKENGAFTGDYDSIKKDIMRKPFQKVASDYQFNSTLLEEGLQLLKEMTCDVKMAPFEDYHELKKILGKKFLVTAGFTKMQWSKIKQLKIEEDFHEIHIVDPQISTKTKKDVFNDIIERYSFDVNDVLVIGDDPNSEIQAARELGIDALLYDKLNFNTSISNLSRITNFCQLDEFIK